MKTFAVTGIDGCGKSTLISGLRNALGSGYGTVTVASIWDSLLINSKDLQLDPASLQTYLSRLNTNARAHFLLHAWWQAIDAARYTAPDILLLDTYWYKYFAAEQVRSQNHNMTEFAESLPVPDSIFWIQIPVEMAASRKKNFTLFETGFNSLTRDSFCAFQAQVESVLKNWLVWENVVAVDGTAPPEILVSDIRKFM